MLHLKLPAPHNNVCYNFFFILCFIAHDCVFYFKYKCILKLIKSILLNLISQTRIIVESMFPFFCKCIHDYVLFHNRYNCKRRIEIGAENYYFKIYK